MTIKFIIPMVCAAGLAACSLPSLPSLPSFSFDGEGVEKQSEISCETAGRMNLKALDWPGVKTVDVHILNKRFIPATLVLKMRAPNIIRVFNGDKALRTFLAQEFF